MDGIEKLAMKQLRSQLYELSNRIEEHYSKLNDHFINKENTPINIHTAYSPMSFIKRDMENVLSSFQAFQIN